MKDKMLNILIIILFLIVTFLGILFYRNLKIISNERFNTEIAQFIVETMKGHKVKNDIELLEVNDKIKEALLLYYDKTFFDNNNDILVFEGVSYLNSAITEIKKCREEARVNGVFDSIRFRELINSRFFVLGPTGDEDWNVSQDEKERMEYLEFCYGVSEVLNFSKINDISSDLIEKDDNLYVKVSSLNFREGEDIKYYKGYPLVIYSDALEKKVIYDVQQSKKYQSIEIFNEINEENLRYYFVRDNLNNSYNFTFVMKRGKVVEIRF